MDQGSRQTRDNTRAYPASTVLPCGGTMRCNRSALVKAEGHSTPVIADDAATLTSRVSDQPVGDSKGQSVGAFQFPCVSSEAHQKQPVCRESAPIQTRSGRIGRPPKRLDCRR